MKKEKKKSQIIQLVIFAMVLLVFSIQKVNAESVRVPGSGQTSGINVSPYARFYSTINGVATACTTQTSEEYISYGGYYSTAYYYYDTGTCSYDREVGIAFNLYETLMEGYVYSLQIFVGGGSVGPDYYATLSNKYSDGLSLGPNLGQAALSFTNKDYVSNILYKTNSIGSFSMSLGSVSGLAVSIITYVFVADKNVSSVFVPYSPQGTVYVGYNLENLGEYNSMTNLELSEKIDSMKEQQQETNNKLDEINNADISEKDKELPDNSGYKDYESAEGELKDKVNQVDLSVLNLGIDDNSSSFIWYSMTKFLQSHAAVFGMMISILTIGIIKLALGR